MNSGFDGLNAQLITKYSTSGPRYTSYPTAPLWKDNFTEDDYAAGLNEHLSTRTSKALSLYVHFPFCENKCAYCACNSDTIDSRLKIAAFISSLQEEVQLLIKQTNVLDGSYIEQLHIGGGSPSYMNEAEFEKFLAAISPLIEKSKLSEFSIEIDPRGLNNEKLQFYAACGIDRISFGVQDLDPRVQEAIGRVQPAELLVKALSAKNKSYFKSINFDLIYGLPFQTGESFKATLDAVKELRPNRIAIYNYAHMPKLKPNQMTIREEDLPSAEEKTKILVTTINSLLGGGYNYIGMDHFALPEDDLSLALENGTLYRNFMGYTTAKARNLIGLGPTSISGFGRYYAQNVRDTALYAQLVGDKILPTSRGLRLSDDDLLRRDIINSLICNFYLNFAAIEKAHGICFKDYFGPELNSLVCFIDDGLLTVNEKSMKVSFQGRVFIRNICMVFDAYLKKDEQRQFSKTI
ncbi:MAG: oxygen-independent coproporphyrinogen III oxidase [Deltaproteobacteria bacterium]|nr:oxygen-independent coproporphyrinogen III oxidase [Deltaproteobacteria bacterium]